MPRESKEFKESKESKKNKDTKEYSFVLYIRKTCPYCKLAIELVKKLQKKHPYIKFRSIDIEKDRNRKMLKNDSNIPKDYAFVPKIKVNNEFIGGFDKLIKYSKKTFNFDL
jgi:glutaredoxin